MVVFVKFDIIWIFVIHTNFVWLFVTIKSRHPGSGTSSESPSSITRNDVVQDEEHGENIEDQVYDCMEEDGSNNIIEDDGTNAFIQYMFTSWMDDDIFDDIHDVPLLVKENQPLYEGLRTNLHLLNYCWWA